MAEIDRSRFDEVSWWLMARRRNGGAIARKLRCCFVKDVTCPPSKFQDRRFESKNTDGCSCAASAVADVSGHDH